MHRICVCRKADLIKMYRQIFVEPASICCALNEIRRKHFQMFIV
jgi:hypothetical protein